jgi:hypothetical protein
MWGFKSPLAHHVIYQNFWDKPNPRNIVRDLA